MAMGCSKQVRQYEILKFGFGFSVFVVFIDLHCIIYI